MNDAPYLASGQIGCYDSVGDEIPCLGSGQDGETRRGRPWPSPRFERDDALVLDLATGLTWPRDASPAGFPLTWAEALAFVAELNRDLWLGHGDWRLPNRRELRSLMSHQTRRPALPEDHPFENVFSAWYWSSTSAAIAPSHAWYVHMEGARMFYGGKDQSYMVWPVCGVGNGVLARTGQRACFDSDGHRIACAGSGQDGELRLGRAWPEPRFEARSRGVLDRLSGLLWRRDADLTGMPVAWEEALAAVRALASREPDIGWRLPNINELELLVDAARATPALPAEAPFDSPRDGYWSSTTSAFEADWAWALYLNKGAIGVGQKSGRHFHVWAVADLSA